MSDVANQTDLNSADIVDAEAAAWFRRRNFWSWSDTDQTALDVWLEKSPIHEIAYWRIAGAWSRTERMTALRQPMKIPELSRRSLFPFVKSVAASFAFIVMASMVAWSYLSPPAEQVFQTPVGGHKILKFSDGTSIELNTDTVLRTQIANDRRIAELVRGEAYFRVRHNGKVPFVVTAAGRKVTDLGTEFSIRAGQGTARIVLFEGRAAIEPTKSENAAHAIVLTPGDVAVASASAVTVTRKSTTDLRDSAAWRRGLLVFRYLPLRDAVAEVNRYSAEKLVIADDTIATRTVYGTVPTRSVEGFVRVARSALGLHVEKRGNEYTISR